MGFASVKLSSFLTCNFFLSFSTGMVGSTAFPRGMGGAGGGGGGGASSPGGGEGGGGGGGEGPRGGSPAFDPLEELCGHGLGSVGCLDGAGILGVLSLSLSMGGGDGNCWSGRELLSCQRYSLDAMNSHIEVLSSLSIIVRSPLAEGIQSKYPMVM